MSFGLGIDPLQNLYLQQQQDYLAALARQQAGYPYHSQFQNMLSQNIAAQPANPDERLLVLLTED